MTTLTLEINNEWLVESFKNIVFLNGVKIKEENIEKKNYSKEWKDLLEAIW